MNTQTEKTWIVGVLVALAASLCCITPVLALISGISGIAAAFSSLEPARPFLIGITLVVLGFAWYQKLKPRNSDTVTCDCETDKKQLFWHTKTFLGIVTGLAIGLLTFPVYAHIFYPEPPAIKVVVIENDNIRQTELKISGMTCQGCAEHVNHSLDGVPGVLEHNTSYNAGTSIVKYDMRKTTEQELVNAVNATGYAVTGTRLIERETK